MTHNNHVHSATRKTPFELLFGYQPQWPGQILPNNAVPAGAQRIEELQTAREEAKAAMKIAQESMKIQNNRYGSEGSQWKIGDLVWLEGKNLKTQYPTAKLSPKRFGPFEITNLIGTTSYQLKLLAKWKTHNVFHGSLLTPYKETKAHGHNFTRPTPVIIDDQEEYEVEEIINIWKHRNQWQYLVKWKGYPDSENSWEPLKHRKHAEKLRQKWHKDNPKASKPTSLEARLAQLNSHGLKILQEIINNQIRLKKPYSRRQV